MQQLTLAEMANVGGGGGVRVGTDGAGNIVDAIAAKMSGGSATVVQPMGGRVDPGGANNGL